MAFSYNYDNVHVRFDHYSSVKNYEQAKSMVSFTVILSICCEYQMKLDIFVMCTKQCDAQSSVHRRNTLLILS